MVIIIEQYSETTFLKLLNLKLIHLLEVRINISIVQFESLFKNQDESAICHC